MTVSPTSQLSASEQLAVHLRTTPAAKFSQNLLKTGFARLVQRLLKAVGGQCRKNGRPLQSYPLPAADEPNPMDREIDISFRRQRMWRRTMMLVAVAALVAAVFVWGPRLIKPTVARARIRTAKGGAGAVGAQITAPGNGQPQFGTVV